MITIDLRQAMTVKVPDAAKVEKTYKLVAGLNEVPREVADHWYVKKFLRPVRRVPRVVVPSSARPSSLQRATAKATAEALKPVVTSAPALPSAPAEKPAAPAPAPADKAEKA
jgi:hypothetical protein